MGAVLTIADISTGELTTLLQRYQALLHIQAPGETISGSFWGDSEAGLIGNTVYVRADTPIHSLLHEFSHFICMSSERRESLHRDAGGDDLEEAAVCYLQILLADDIDGVGRARMMQDMDSWGYSFRLGSTAQWFAKDADDARRWLESAALIDQQGLPAYRLRKP